MSRSAQVALDSQEFKKRKIEIIAISVLALTFLVLAFFAFRLMRSSGSLPFANSIFFFGLLNVNALILIALLWLIFKNVGKLFFERRSRLLGSRLKTKLVVAFLSFSIIPTLLLFIISSLYINSSFDKWFSVKIQNTLEASIEITRNYYKSSELNAMHFAELLSKQMALQLKRNESDFIGAKSTWTGKKSIQDFLDEQRALLAIDSVEFYSDILDNRVLSATPVDEPISKIYPRLALDVLERAFGGEKFSIVQHMPSGDLIRSLVPVGTPASAVLSVNASIPSSLVSRMGEISGVVDDYKDINPLRYSVKTAYFVILVMITLVIIFVAIWMGLFLARQLTVPVERLVFAARSVGAGRFDVSLEESGNDEISVLIGSFNKMTKDLKENRRRLSEANTDLEKRKLQLEAILSNVGTGVLVVDPKGELTNLNRAGAQLLGVDLEMAIGKNYREVFEIIAPSLILLIERSFELSKSGAGVTPEYVQWSVKSAEEVKSLAAIASVLKETTDNLGIVVVVDDITHLIKGQREMAWREVARRIAHEIKNPLTPIKLSAQRLQRRLMNIGGKDGQLLKECTDTIIRHTDELKEMVNEFSNFARLPEVNPSPNQLTEVLEEVLSLYQTAHVDVRFEYRKENKAPVFEFDRDQIKRVLINLFDNAVAALKAPRDGKQKKIDVSLHYNEQLQLVVVIVEDNGPGMNEEVKSRLFEPYFSTKEEGTGLGLAIAKRIVNDHDGYIRVQSQLGKGTQFLIELPTQTRRNHGNEIRTHH